MHPTQIDPPCPKSTHSAPSPPPTPWWTQDPAAIGPLPSSLERLHPQSTPISMSSSGSDLPYPSEERRKAMISSWRCRDRCTLPHIRKRTRRPTRGRGVCWLSSSTWICRGHRPATTLSSCCRTPFHPAVAGQFRGLSQEIQIFVKTPTSKTLTLEIVIYWCMRCNFKSSGSYLFFLYFCMLFFCKWWAGNWISYASGLYKCIWVVQNFNRFWLNFNIKFVYKCLE